ncbi:unnamed protein product [Calypogeia fissa]
MPDDSLSLHSLANGGQDGKLDPKSEAPVPSGGGERESAPPKELKSEITPSAKEHVSSEEQVPATSEPEPSFEITSSAETPAAEEATPREFSTTVELPPPSSKTQEGKEASTQLGELEETEAGDIPGALKEPESQVKETEAVDVPVEKPHVSISSGIEEQLEASGPAAAEPADEIAGEATDPAQENPALLASLPTAKKSILSSLPTRRLKDDELKEKVVIPSYLSQGILVAVESAGVVYHDGPRIENVRAPESPILVFINSKSGGQLGPALEALLVDLIAPAQVYDLSKCKPEAVLRHGLGFLEKEADAGDKCALETRNNMRIMVAGGDGTVGWVLGCIAELGQNERFKVPPVGIIPLGTGNDLSRSFRWGGGITSLNRRDVKRCLAKCIDADVATLDCWQLVVKPAPTRQDAPLQLPHAMHPHHHTPLENPGSDKEESKISPYFEGSFWNYFSIGMDAQVAYGFHHLRNEVPWITKGRISNQMVYGGYSCAQGWFCTPCAATPIHRGLRRILKVYTKPSHDADAQWEQLQLPPGIRAIVILNLQSYAGGRNPWGRPSTSRREKEGYMEAKCDDGVLEIVGLKDGWHTAFVLLDWLSAVRLGQARAVKLELNGKHHTNQAYMQMDGEPWQQPLGEEDDPPAVIELSHNPVQSLCLSIKKVIQRGLFRF